MVKQISDNEIYLLIKYIKSVLWRVEKRMSYIEDARCLKVNDASFCKILIQFHSNGFIKHLSHKPLKTEFIDHNIYLSCRNVYGCLDSTGSGQGPAAALLNVATNFQAL
jgi:hypothetical protein